jgi:hypothetical protein
MAERYHVKPPCAVKKLPESATKATAPYLKICIEFSSVSLRPQEAMGVPKFSVKFQAERPET